MDGTPSEPGFGGKPSVFFTKSIDDLAIPSAENQVRSDATSETGGHAHPFSRLHHSPPRNLVDIDRLSLLDDRGRLRPEEEKKDEEGCLRGEYEELAKFPETGGQFKVSD